MYYQILLNWDTEQYCLRKRNFILHCKVKTTRHSLSMIPTENLDPNQKIPMKNKNQSQLVFPLSLLVLTIDSLNLTDSDISEIGSDSDTEDDSSTHHRSHSSAHRSPRSHSAWFPQCLRSCPETPPGER